MAARVLSLVPRMLARTAVRATAAVAVRPAMVLRSFATAAPAAGQVQVSRAAAGRPSAEPAVPGTAGCRPTPLATARS